MPQEPSRPSPPRKVYLVLPSVHHVMRARDALAKENIHTETAATPRAISSDCGVSLVVPEGSIDTIRRLLEGLGLAPEFWAVAGKEIERLG